MSNDYLFSGDLYLARLGDDGAFSGYEAEAFEAATVEITESAEIKSRKSKKRATYGQTRSTVALKNPGKIKVVLNEVSSEALAMALLGSNATLAVTAGEVTSAAPEAVTLIPGKLVRLDHRNITANGTGTEIVIETAAETPVSIPLTDVEITLVDGFIQYTGSTLTEPTACTISYSYEAEAGSRISGGVQPTIRARFLLSMNNLVDGSRAYLEVDEATLTPSDPIDFMSDDYLTVALEGEMVTLSNKTSPYILDLLNAA